MAEDAQDWVVPVLAAAGVLLVLLIIILVVFWRTARRGSRPYRLLVSPGPWSWWREAQDRRWLAGAQRREDARVRARDEESGFAST